MKKTLVLLLILAVAGGIFAQNGEISWSGGVEINGKLNLNTQDPADADKNIATVGAIDDANTKGFVDLSYKNGGLTLGMGFSSTYWDADDNWVNSSSIGLKADYTADRWGAHAEMDLLNSDGTVLGGKGPTQLWGYYTFLDNALRFDVAVDGGGNGIWAVSDIVLEEYNIDVDFGGGLERTIYNGWNKLDDGAGFQFVYTGIENLSFGAIFPWDYNNGAIHGTAADGPKFGETFFKQMVIGAKYDNGSIGVSFMLGLQPWSYLDGTDVKDKVAAFTHVGFKFGINDAMTLKADVIAGFGFSDKYGFWDKDGEAASKVLMSFGLNFDYSADPLGVGVTVKFFDLADSTVGDSGNGGRSLVLNPYVSYQINDPLKASLNITLVQGMGEWNKENDALKGKEKVSSLAIEPALDWAVADGASMGFGYCVKFSLDGDLSGKDKLLDHNITLKFKWSF